MVDDIKKKRGQKKACYTCEWFTNAFNSGLCTNPDSKYCGECVGASEYCGKWQKKRQMEIPDQRRVKTKPQTNADRIRSMSDDLLATQLTQIFYEGVLALTKMKLPNEILDEIRSQILEKLQQPVKED